MNSFRLFVACSCAVMVAVFATACGRGLIDTNAAVAPEHGHLVIVGGALKADNSLVRERFVQLCANGPIGVIPIASGDGLKAGEESAQGWRKWAGSRPVIVIPLTENGAAKADDPVIAQQIASCGGLWFTGGDQSRVVKVLKPDGRRSACLDACFRVLAGNGVIGGTSAGAALMSDPMITGGPSRGRPTREPDDTAPTVRTGPGLGFLTSALTDQHFLERARMGRLIDAMRATGVRIGLGVRENSAVVVDRATTECEPIGNHAVCAIVLEGDCARVSVLSTGDHANLRAFSATPSDKLIRVQNSGAFEHAENTPDPWGLKWLQIAFDELGQGNGKFTFIGERMTVTLEADDQSALYEDALHQRPPFLGALRVCQQERTPGK